MTMRDLLGVKAVYQPLEVEAEVADLLATLTHCLLLSKSAE